MQVLNRPAFTCSMLEKLIWICAFMLVGARHGGCTVGEVEAQASWGDRASMLSVLWQAVARECGGSRRQAGVGEGQRGTGLLIEHSGIYCSPVPAGLTDVPFGNGIASPQQVLSSVTCTQPP